MILKGPMQVDFVCSLAYAAPYSGKRVVGVERCEIKLILLLFCLVGFSLLGVSLCVHLVSRSYLRRSKAAALPPRV